MPRISRSRRTIENAFGIMCAKWRILFKAQETAPETTDVIVKAICCIHNFLIEEAETNNPMEMADNGDDEDGAWRAQINPLGQANIGHGGANQEGADLRKKLMNFFVNEGNVDWQDDMVYV